MRIVSKSSHFKMLVLSMLALYLCAACGGKPAATRTLPTALPEAIVEVSPAAAVPTGTAAATAVPPTPTAAPRPIRVIKTAPVANVVSNEEYPFSNCGGTVPLQQPFSAAAQVSAEVVIADVATRSDGTTIAVDDARRAELAQEVELAYAPELAAARAAVDEARLVAAPFTRWNVLIIWEDRVFAAAVSFPSDGPTAGAAPLTATTAYTYTQHVPSIGYYMTMPCTA